MVVNIPRNRASSSPSKLSVLSGVMVIELNLRSIEQRIKIKKCLISSFIPKKLDFFFPSVFTTGRSEGCQNLKTCLIFI